jgi:hypothetical protein
MQVIIGYAGYYRGMLGNIGVCLAIYTFVGVCWVLGIKGVCRVTKNMLGMQGLYKLPQSAMEIKKKKLRHSAGLGKDNQLEGENRSVKRGRKPYVGVL